MTTDIRYINGKQYNCWYRHHPQAVDFVAGLRKSGAKCRRFKDSVWIISGEMDKAIEFELTWGVL